MNLFHAAVLGVVEGLTEFLPVSSTGHLVLASKLLGLGQTDFLKTFEISIQLGAILAVVCLYGKKLLTTPAILGRVFVAFLPAAAVGAVFYKIIKRSLLGRPDIVTWALFIGGALLVLFEIFHKEKDSADSRLEEISYQKSFLIGLGQCLAMVPGVSRSAATILAGLGLGVRRKTIVEFSFLLAIPTMLAATALDLVKNAGSFSQDQVQFLLVGGAVSFVVAILSIRFLMHYIKQHNFIPFGIYRIAVALSFWFLR